MSVEGGCPDSYHSSSLQGYGEEDYLIFDCPGQIELYSHVSAFKSLVDWLKAQVTCFGIFSLLQRCWVVQ